MDSSLFANTICSRYNELGKIHVHGQICMYWILLLALLITKLAFLWKSHLSENYLICRNEPKGVCGVLPCSCNHCNCSNNLFLTVFIMTSHSYFYYPSISSHVFTFFFLSQQKFSLLLL
ncbi:hypothetical protein VIGAN_01142800 [Vigna angularis var. angularis]|uniref:Uncharacterized protein n=1 Tax=Vigna angularis var. angularis TaxID=157739 RepID=A0A0S3R038_PHAAN|nr:hypothetical protein VIGAN_01142800 [Vigna angularis var. angularis]